MFEKKPPALRANPDQLVELTSQRSASAAAAVRRHREPVSLIADHLQELQSRLVSIQPHRLFYLRQVNLFLPLGQPGDGGLLDSQLAQCGQRRVELTPATINQNQIRKRLLLFQHSL